MQALRLQKKYPEVTQDEMFDLINRFKYVPLRRFGSLLNRLAVRSIRILQAA